MSADLLKKLIEAGTPADLIAEVAMLAGEVAALERRRASDRERQRTYRNEHNVTSRDTTDVTDKGALEVSPHTPLPKPTKSAPLSPPKLKGVQVPDWVPAEAWAAFKEMRRKMRSVPFTETAERGIIADLEKGRAEGHCPAKMLLKAVKNGHRAIFPDETTRAAKNGKVELTAQQWRERAEQHIKFGRHDNAEECRRKAIAIEQGLAA